MNSITNLSVIKKLSVLFLAIAGLHYAKDFLVPVCFAGILATLFLPLCRKLEQKKISRSLAVATCMIMLFTIVIAIGAIISWQIAELANGIVAIREKILESTDTVQLYIFDHFGIAKTDQSRLLNEQQSIIADSLSAVANSLSTVFTDVLFVLIYMLFFLSYRSHIKKFLVQLAHKENQEETEELISRATHVSQQYLLGISKIIIILWVIYAISFSLLGLKNAVLLAIVCGFFEVIPYLGNILGTALNVLLAVINGADLYLIAGIVITYAMIQLFRGWVLEPLILGRQVKINPLSTIMALVIGQLIWGIPGIILSIPLTGIMKIIFDHIDALKPYGFLIGEIANKNPTLNTNTV